MIAVALAGSRSAGGSGVCICHFSWVWTGRLRKVGVGGMRGNMCVDDE